MDDRPLPRVMYPPISDPSVLDIDRARIAGAQPRTASRPEPRLCAVVLSDREVGIVPSAERCNKLADALVDFYDYRTGVTVDGVFTPAESINTRACAAHLEALRDAPGFLRSRSVYA